METVSLSIDSALFLEIERRRGGRTRSAFLSGLVRAALAANIVPAPSTGQRGRPPRGNRLGSLRRMISRRGEVPFDEFVRLYARITAPVPSVLGGTCEVEALRLISQGAFEWAPSGWIRVPIHQLPPDENTLAGWSEIILGKR